MIPSPASTLRVHPGGSSEFGAPYDVLVGSGLLQQIGSRIADRLGPGARVLIVRDAGVPQRHANAVEAGLTRAGLASKTISWAPDEATKSLTGAARLLEVLAAERFDRRSAVVALGGGITGDVAGFVAAVYQRGVAWVSCPCTLLAMVDSSVGGKTGVNLTLQDQPGTLLKNMVGVVHHPMLVVADLDTIESLPGRALRSGLAECIKHAMIGADWEDPGLMDWTCARRAEFLHRVPAALAELVTRSVALKARVVAADERENADSPGGGRMALNLGHTFGHAIETLPGLTWSGQASLQHGEAVALGLVAATGCAAALKLVPSSILDEVKQVVSDFGLPTKVKGLPADDAIIERMSHDKKARGGVLRLILPVGRGRVKVVSDPPRDAVLAGLAAIRG